MIFIIPESRHNPKIGNFSGGRVKIGTFSSGSSKIGTFRGGKKIGTFDFG